MCGRLPGQHVCSCYGCGNGGGDVTDLVPREETPKSSPEQLGTGLGRWFTGCLTLTLCCCLCLCRQDLAGLTGVLTEVGSVSTPPGLLGPQALLEWGQGCPPGCPPTGLGEGHSSVCSFSVCQTQCSCTRPLWTQPDFVPATPSHPIPLWGWAWGWVLAGSACLAAAMGKHMLREIWVYILTLQ